MEKQKYKIGEVSRLLSISIDTLRYYESRGIVSPQKDEDTNYRYYDAWDLNFLLDSKWYRSFEFSLSDTEKIINEDSLDDLLGRCVHHEGELLRTITEYQRKLRALVALRQRMSRMRMEKGTFRLGNSPELIYQRHRYRYEYNLSDTACPQLAKWLNQMPYVDHTFEVPEAWLKTLDGRDDNPDEGDYYWGFSLSPEEAIRSGITLEPPVEYFPPKKSMYTVFNAKERGSFIPSLLEQVVRPIQAQGYIINGSIMGHLISRTHEGDGFERYFEVWVPVR